MRKIPAYDWVWFETHTPFKKIFEETCGLVIEKEVFGNAWSRRIHYHIKLNYLMLQNNFEEIKRRILNTRVCKHNKEIFDYVNEMECSKMDVSSLIVDGCTASRGSATFSWELKV